MTVSMGRVTGRWTHSASEPSRMLLTGLPERAERGVGEDAMGEEGRATERIAEARIAEGASCHEEWTAKTTARSRG